MNKYYVVYNTKHKQYLTDVFNIMGITMFNHGKKENAMKFKTKTEAKKYITDKYSIVEELIEEN